MARCKLIQPQDRKFRSVVPEQPEILKAFRDADTDVSTTMACGVTVFENAKLPWSVAYDEYFYCLYCLEGTLRVHEGDTVHEMHPGDGMWLPKGSEVIYEAQGRCRLVFAIYPINWRELQGKA